MTIKMQTVRTCDVCGRQVTDVSDGWFILEKHQRSNKVAAVRHGVWDVCSARCLAQLAARLSKS